MKVKCPYCGEEVRIDYAGELDEDEYHSRECRHCGKTFSYHLRLSVEITDVSQAPCLNGGLHTFQSFRRVVRCNWVDMRRCQHCGIEEEIKP